MSDRASMPPLDAEGYLIDPADWTEAVGEALARSIGIVLEDDHREVIAFIRAWWEEHQVAPDARHVMKQLERRYPGRGRARLFELFPYGYVGQACKVAGMRRPRAWSTG